MTNRESGESSESAWDVMALIKLKVDSEIANQLEEIILARCPTYEDVLDEDLRSFIDEHVGRSQDDNFKSDR